MVALWTTANQVDGARIQYLETFYDASSARYESHTAVRHCQIDPLDMLGFQKAMLGWTELGDDQRNPIPIAAPGVLNIGKGIPASTLIRHPPASHPDRPYLFATTCDFSQFLGPTGRIDGRIIAEDFGLRPIPLPGTMALGGKLNLEYSVQYDYPEDGIQYLNDLIGVGQPNELWRYIKRRVEYGVVNAPIPKITLQVYKDNNGGLDPVSQPGAKILGDSTLYYTWMQIPSAYGLQGQPILPGKLETNIANCIGTVNSGTFDGYSASTLICLAPKRRLLPQSDGQYVWELMYVFGQRGWDPGNTLPGLDANHFTSTIPSWQRSLIADGTFGYVVRQDKVTPLYTTSDFTKLFSLI